MTELTDKLQLWRGSLRYEVRTLKEAWKASRSAVGILNKVQSLAISAPVVDSSNLNKVIYCIVNDIRHI